jgi:ATP-dependent DNA helicase RecG
LLLVNNVKKYTIQPQTTILDTPIEFLKGVGPQRAALLRKELGMDSYEQLLQHFPIRYIDTQGVTFIKDINNTQEYVQLRGVLLDVKEEGQGFRKRLSATLYDKTGSIELVWFQGWQYWVQNLKSNTIYAVMGKLNFFNGNYNITHPELEVYQPQQQEQVTLQPVYSTTEKLKAKGLNNRSFAKILQGLWEKIKPVDIPEYLPPSILERFSLMSRYDAYKNIHFPTDDAYRAAAQRRLKWDELLRIQLQIIKLKLKHHAQEGYVFAQVGYFFNTFYNQHLPFALTNAQKRVIKELRNDTFSGIQMNRLIQGDVGSGKTIVAVMAMLLAMDNGFQASLMAPTEILAQQHYQGIRELLAPLGITVALLTGSVKGKARKQILEALQLGTIHIVIGTHALVEDTVVFKALGLAVIDEQHRFGVTQRAKLWAKNTKPPHMLVMTATPIPRTLAMTIYGDLDVSVIDELPPGRKSIETIHRSENFRPKVMQFLKHEIEKGRQIYIVYPLIEESEKLDFESLKAGYEQVKAWFPDPTYKVAMVHGKQAVEEKERNMQRFVQGDAHILVATTVIEVGVNVPNASVMVIESSERFGLSQLHQLRGRVGRGSEKSYCFLLTGSEISKESRARMHIMTQTNDGFIIAEEDLKMRGPGDIYGTRQSGTLQFKIADIVHDVAIMEETKQAALQILQQDPNLMQPAHSGIQQLLQANHSNTALPWSKIS